MRNAKRIMIVGQSGSGKSTLARALGAALNLPVIHIDHIHWKSGWVERTGPEKDTLCSQVHARETWIFEGGRIPSWPERLDRADALIWLDFPLAIRAWRVFWRTVRNRNNTPPDLPEGCPERFTWQFTQWIWTSRQTHRVAMQRLFDGAPIEKYKRKLSTKAEVSAFIDGLADSQE